jgi:hypothetical protein
LKVRASKEGRVELLVGDDVKDAFDPCTTPVAKGGKNKRKVQPGASAKKRKTATKKQSKNDSKVKGARSAYIIFGQENRAEITSKAKEANPSIKPKEITCLIGEAWRRLSEVEKEDFTEKAQKDRARFNREKEEEAEAKGEPLAKKDGKKAKKPTKRSKREKTEEELDEDFIADDDEDLGGDEDEEGLSHHEIAAKMEGRGEDAEDDSSVDDDEDDDSESEDEDDAMDTAGDAEEQSKEWLAKWTGEGGTMAAVPATFGEEWQEQLVAIEAMPVEQIAEALQGVAAQLEDEEATEANKEAYGFLQRFATELLEVKTAREAKAEEATAKQEAKAKAREERATKREAKVAAKKAKEEAKKAEEKTRKEAEKKAKKAKKRKEREFAEDVFSAKWFEAGELVTGLQEMFASGNTRDGDEEWKDHMLEIIRRNANDIEEGLKEFHDAAAQEEDEDTKAVCTFMATFAQACLVRRQHSDCRVNKKSKKDEKFETRERAKEEKRLAKQQEKEEAREEKRREKEEEKEALRVAREEEKEAFESNLPEGWRQEEKLKPDSRGVDRACIVYVGPSGKKYGSQAAVTKALEKEAAYGHQSTKSAGFMQGFLQGTKTKAAQKQAKKLTPEEEEARVQQLEDDAMCRALEKAEYTHAKTRREREAADKIARALDSGMSISVDMNKEKEKKDDGASNDDGAANDAAVPVSADASAGAGEEEAADGASTAAATTDEHAWVQELGAAATAAEIESCVDTFGEEWQEQLLVVASQELSELQEGLEGLEEQAEDEEAPAALLFMARFAKEVCARKVARKEAREEAKVQEAKAARGRREKEEEERATKKVEEGRALDAALQEAEEEDAEDEEDEDEGGTDDELVAEYRKKGASVNGIADTFPNWRMELSEIGRMEDVGSLQSAMAGMNSKMAFSNSLSEQAPLELYISFVQVRGMFVRTLYTTHTVLRHHSELHCSHSTAHLFHRALAHPPHRAGLPPAVARALRRRR